MPFSGCSAAVASRVCPHDRPISLGVIRAPARVSRQGFVRRRHRIPVRQRFFGEHAGMEAKRQPFLAAWAESGDCHWGFLTRDMAASCHRGGATTVPLGTAILGSRRTFGSCAAERCSFCLAALSRECRFRRLPWPRRRAQKECRRLHKNPPPNANDRGRGARPVRSARRPSFSQASSLSAQTRRP